MMETEEIITHIAEANKLARKSSLTLVPVMQALNNYNTPDEIRHKNMHLADSLIKFIQDSEDLQAMIEKQKELA